MDSNATVARKTTRDNRQANMNRPPVVSRSIQICPNPIFIIGSPRSGTTALALSLAKHSQLWTSAESDFLYHLFLDDQIGKALAESKRRPDSGWLQTNRVNDSEFYESLGLGLNALFTSRSKGKRWIDQTPLYTLIAESLAKTFPGAQFIHIVRDGRRVVSSMLNFLNALPKKRGIEAARIDGNQIGHWTSDFTEACKTWGLYTGRAMDFGKKYPDRCIAVVNEDLIKDPAREFDRILSFLRLTPENKPAEFFGSHRINSSFGSTSRNPKVVKRLSAPWKDWSSTERRTFMQEAGRLLVDLQFEGALEFFEENSNQEVDSTVQTDATTLKEEKGDVTDGLVVPQALLDEIIEESQVQFRIMQEEHESNLLALQQQHTQALERAELDLKLLSDQTDAKLADYQNRISELEDRLNVASATITRFESEVNYEKVRQKVCGTISKRIPGRSRVSVVSKGDDELLKLNGHIATHFPQTETGEYAGFYPADTTEVIERIGEVIAKGGEYLVFPEASFWWMDYYADLQTYLDSTHERIWQDEACIIYGL